MSRRKVVWFAPTADQPLRCRVVIKNGVARCEMRGTVFHNQVVGGEPMVACGTHIQAVLGCPWRAVPEDWVDYRDEELGNGTAERSA